MTGECMIDPFDRSRSNQFLRKGASPRVPAAAPASKEVTAETTTRSWTTAGGHGMARLERVLLVATLSATVALGGCGALAPAPYNGRESCQGVGGIYTSDGRCLAGNV